MLPSLKKKRANVAPPNQGDTISLTSMEGSNEHDHDPFLDDLDSGSTAYSPNVKINHKPSPSYATEATPFNNSYAHQVNWTGRDDPPEPTWLERKLHLPKPLIWLLFNSIVSICWGTALAVFMSGVVTVTFAFSKALKDITERHDFDYTNELIGLVGSFATMHVTHVLQLAVAEYSHIVLAGDFTSRDLKWMQGVNEMSLFAEFPPRLGEDAPPSLGWWATTWWSIVNWFTALRLSWYIVYIGVALHTMSIVAIMSPNLKIQHVEFNDLMACGVEASAVTLGAEPFLSAAQQEVIDKLSFDVGLQLAGYTDQSNGNSTSVLAGRVYRKESYAYGAIGGLNDALQDNAGVLFTAECADGRDVPRSTELWQRSLPGLSPPTAPAPFTSFIEAPDSAGPALPATFRRVVSDPAGSLNFSISITQGAMYGVVDPLGNGAFMIVARGRDPPAPMRMVCAWRTGPKVVHVQIVKSVSLAVGANDSTLYPSLTGRATLQTLRGMAMATHLGATLDPEANKNMRTEILRIDEGMVSLRVPSVKILEYVLADGVKAAVTAYNSHFWHLARDENRAEGTPLPALCNSKNKTVTEHWKFGNNKYLGWIAVIWTIGIGILGVVLTFWMARKKSNRMAISPLDAMGGFMLGRGGEIADDQRLRIVDGKVVDVPPLEKL